jgi:truncated hemoglobin YjbI
MALFDLLGEERLRAILADFYDRVFGDVMIGFMFRGADKARLIDREYELVARALGAETRYTGEPLRSAHARHRIMGGQFARRLTLLKQALEAHGVPEEIRRVWIEHNEALRPAITGDEGGSCDPELARKRAEGAAEDPSPG